MKKMFLVVLIIPMCVGSCTREKAAPLEGAWKLAYEYEISDGKTTVLYPGISKGTEWKVWSGEYWVLIGRFEQDSTFTDNYAGGTFTLEGNRYTEDVEYHSAPQYLGQRVQLLVEIKQDTVIQTWPVDADGEIITSGSYFVEKWARLR